MYLARFLNKVFKKGGFILTDADSKDYIIGQPTDNPIKLKISDGFDSIRFLNVFGA